MGEKLFDGSVNKGIFGTKSSCYSSYKKYQKEDLVWRPSKKNTDSSFHVTK